MVMECILFLSRDIVKEQTRDWLRNSLTTGLDWLVEFDSVWWIILANLKAENRLAEAVVSGSGWIGQ